MAEPEAPASLVGGYGSDEDDADDKETAGALPAGFFDAGEEPAAKRAKTEEPNDVAGLPPGFFDAGSKATTGVDSQGSWP